MTPMFSYQPKTVLCSDVANMKVFKGNDVLKYTILMRTQSVTLVHNIFLWYKILVSTGAT